MIYSIADFFSACGGVGTVRSFVELMQRGEANGTYLFDWGLPKYCGALMRDFTVPRHLPLHLQ